MTANLHPIEPGCIFEGHRGHYAHVDVIALALAYVMPEADDKYYSRLVSDYRSTWGMGDLCEFSAEASDEAQDWLNDNVAAADYVFHWFDGEFFYSHEDET